MLDNVEAKAPAAVMTSRKPTETELFHDLIQSIVSALEARDPHTAEHSLRVGTMVETTCLLMGLPDDETITIRMAAHVHDIGKIGIPDCVLLKQGRKSPEEHETLHSHAKIGADILKRCASLQEVATIVLHHHERWDGRGYPDKLYKEQIPLGSRIISVCDSVDAMLGKRVHSKSITIEECKQEIVYGLGSMYDPEIALFVLEHWDEIVMPIDFRDAAASQQGPVLTLSCCVPHCALVSASA